MPKSREITHIGQFICDMHGRSLTGWQSHELAEHYEVRDPITFYLDDERQVGMTPAAQAFLAWLDACCRQSAGNFYMNKHLVIVGESNDHGVWFTAACCWDGRLAGICEIRERVVPKEQS